MQLIMKRLNYRHLLYIIDKKNSMKTNGLLFMFRPRLMLYSAGSGVNRVQVVLSGLIMRLLCCVQSKVLYNYGCLYFLAALMQVLRCALILE